MMVYENQSSFLRANGYWFDLSVDRLTTKAAMCIYKNIYKRHCRIGKITMKPKA